MRQSRFSNDSGPLPFPDLAAMTIIAAAMIAVSGLTPLFPSASTPYGFCLPSPNLWGLAPAIGWSINTFLLLVCAAAWVFLNKEYTLVKGTDHITLVAFLVLVGSNPLCTERLTTGSILLAVTVLCLAILFSATHRLNCTHQIFAIYTFLSVGSMFQYAFIPMMAVFFIASLIMKTMRAKEFVAMLLGIAAPYWVAVGLGIVRFTDFRLPEVSYMFSDFTASTRNLTLIINIGFSLILALVTWTANNVAAFAGNKEARARNNVVSLLIFTTALFIIFDFNNMTAYLPTFYFALAVQTGNFFAYHNIRRKRILIWSFVPLYAAGFALIWLS